MRFIPKRKEGEERMVKKVRIAPKQKGRHLSLSKRCTIEALLNEKQSLRYIAEKLDCSPSTVSREIKKHSFIQVSHKNDCLNKKDCHHRYVCGGNSCPKKCRTCNKCKKYCPDYVQVFCEDLEERGLCNGCHKIAYCSLEKKLYKADVAEHEYREMLVGRRNGFDLTGEQMEEINLLVSPLIKKGQSPYHIKQALGNRLCVSEATLRRMINANELDAGIVDLRDAVKRKPRRKQCVMHSEITSPLKAGRMYEDYLQFIKENDVNVIEMDCVEGKQEDVCAILTLHFVSLHMQLYYIMPEHTAKGVVDTLDMIESTLGSRLFSQIFEVILTDNGHEFWDIDGMETSITTGKRTKIFFCEPNRSDQKGACENNHKIFRYIVPKGTSIDGFSQEDMVLATNHINSYCRKSLFGQSPYDLAMRLMPQDFFLLLGLEPVPQTEVNLTSSLLKHKNRQA